MNQSSAVSTALSLVNGQPVVSSLKVAEHFEKRHDDVLKRIRALTKELAKLDCECPRNFAETSIEVPMPKGGVQTLPSFNLTRDGFTLLAMGFTGKKALAWKVMYIEAFNAMEAQLVGKPAPKALSPSTEEDRKPLVSILRTWVRLSTPETPTPMDYRNAWRRLAAHFNLTSCKEMPAEWIPDAIAFVEAKIDEIPKVLPHDHGRTELPPDLDASAARLRSAVRFALDEALPLYRAIQVLTYRGMMTSPTLVQLSYLQEDLFHALDKNLFALERLAMVATVAAKSNTGQGRVM